MYGTLNIGSLTFMEHFHKFKLIMIYKGFVSFEFELFIVHLLVEQQSFKSIEIINLACLI
jgi:hypothetical protein